MTAAQAHFRAVEDDGPTRRQDDRIVPLTAFGDGGGFLVVPSSCRPVVLVSAAPPFAPFELQKPAHHSILSCKKLHDDKNPWVQPELVRPFERKGRKKMASVASYAAFGGYATSRHFMAKHFDQRKSGGQLCHRRIAANDDTLSVRVATFAF